MNKWYNISNRIINGAVIDMRPDPRAIAYDLGWPDGIPLEDGSVVWMVSPGDDAMTASISFDGVRVCASLMLRYFGKVVTMLRAVFENGQWESAGVISTISETHQDICSRFNTHIEHMLGGPHFVREVYA